MLCCRPFPNVIGSRPSGGSTAPSYVRTAFVNYDNSFNSALNNPENPYGRFDEAIDALTAAYPGEDVTVVLQSNYTGTIDPSTALASALTGAGSLTFKSDDAGPWTITALNIGYVENADLRLDDVTIATLSWANSTSNANPPAGSITGANSPQIGTLYIQGDGFFSGPTDGINGSTVTGADGGTGSDGNPPQNGGDGESVNASGGDGESRVGNSGWDIALFGSGYIDFVTGSGAVATAGNGGIGGTATAGNGGNGGNSTSQDGAENGGNGGNGGNATANGGNGGNATGGNGSQIYKETGWTITSLSLFGGTATAGSGGTQGTANAGSGGAGGSGAQGGNPGNAGDAGIGSDVSGGPGSATNGGDGGINNI